MKYKYTILLISTIFLFFLKSCHKRNYLNKLLDEPAVITLYDNSTNFNEYLKFYIPDSIAFVSDDKSNPTSLNNSNAQSVISKVKDELIGRGYLYAVKDSSDIGVNITILHNINTVTGFYNPGFWWGYPGSWGPGYWGGPMYYGFFYQYHYETGSLIIELIDLKNKSINNNRLKIIWTSEIGDIYNSNINVTNSFKYIEEAFNQSLYLKRN